MSPENLAPAARAALLRMAFEAGQAVGEERRRRKWSLRQVADRAGVGIAVVHAIEAGDAARLESYARVAVALGLEPTLAMTSARTRANATRRTEAEDFVHSAMGEIEARALASATRTIAIDEPYQHYQFAGRADVVAWEGRDLLHIENRTLFPNLQDAAGSYNAKRQYLARALAERAGVGPEGWRSVTHVIACPWSAEVLHVLRLRRATFAAPCPDPPDQLAAWLAGTTPERGTTSSLILLDPTVPFGSRRRRIAGLADAAKAEPRYHGYAETAAALRTAS